MSICEICLNSFGNTSRMKMLRSTEMSHHISQRRITLVDVTSFAFSKGTDCETSCDRICWLDQFDRLKSFPLWRRLVSVNKCNRRNNASSNNWSSSSLETKFVNPRQLIQNLSFQTTLSARRKTVGICQHRLRFNSFPDTNPDNVLIQFNEFVEFAFCSFSDSVFL